MRRSYLIVTLLIGLPIFLVISFFATRGLFATNLERTAVVGLLNAQASGDAEAALSMVPKCRQDPSCVKQLRLRAKSLRRTGKVQILTYQPSMQFALKEKQGVAQVAWRVDEGAAISQCVRVSRTGPISGGRVELLSISAPLARGKTCQSD